MDKNFEQIRKKSDSQMMKEILKSPIWTHLGLFGLYQDSSLYFYLNKRVHEGLKTKPPEGEKINNPREIQEQDNISHL